MAAPVHAAVPRERETESPELLANELGVSCERVRQMQREAECILKGRYSGRVAR